MDDKFVIMDDKFVWDFFFFFFGFCVNTCKMPSISVEAFLLHAFHLFDLKPYQTGTDIRNYIRLVQRSRVLD